ncbi:unnamed protein product [Orchesella dallaii]|uniref:Etoposide-induced protein 2.4 n=1 Tax=Orchesella dallaii TaxID=48710 RepID=A0ABP1QJ47_9HEXA
MSVQEVTRTTLKGVFDSLKGPYWLYSLDSIQSQAHSDRLQFQNVNTKQNISKRARKEEPRLLNRVVQCCTLNGFVFGFSIIIFNNVLLPFLQTVLVTISNFTLGTRDAETNWYATRLILKTTFDSLWVLPLFLLSRLVNALWFQDIGNLAYKYSIGRPKQFASLSTFIADNLFSLIIQVLFLVQATMLSLTPLPAPLPDALYIFHMCLLYSLYSFEYKWVQMGWPLHQRLQYLESNWPYFLGFGLPLSVITYCPSDYFISGSVFAIVFPLFIIAGNEAEVVSVPVKKMTIFRLVVKMSNVLFMGGSTHTPTHNSSHHQEKSPSHRTAQSLNRKR